MKVNIGVSVTQCPLFFQVLCACAVAYVLSLSLALSLSTVASQHYHTYPRATPGPATSCLTTKSACTFHQPAVIKAPSPQRGKSHSFLVGRKEGKNCTTILKCPCIVKQVLKKIRLGKEPSSFGVVMEDLYQRRLKVFQYGPSCHFFAIPNGTNLHKCC